MEYRYAAFISYCHAEADSAIANALHTQIERYTIPRDVRQGKKKLGRVFRDVEELSASSDLSEEICSALDASEHLIVICSENAILSPWVTKEVGYFLSGHDRSKVITVLASGEPKDVFPRELTHVENPDGTVIEIEPLAVDVRAKSVSGSLKKIRQEKCRLFAAMLDCSYDSLVMREQTRQRRRVFSAASVVLALVLSFTGLVLVKNRQIDIKNAELEVKNQTLEQQKNEILLRESELLTASAQEELRNGNQSEAIRIALSALESENGSRPYYPPAEGALLDALGILSGGQETILVKTTITQNLPVADYCISTDGSCLAAVNAYGWITCFDTSTGETMWTRKETASTRIYTGPDNLLLVSNHSDIRAYRFGTGEEVWAFDEPDCIVELDVIGFSDDLSLMALHATRYENIDRYLLAADGVANLTFLNTADGSVRCEVPHTETELDTLFSTHYSGGVFSSDKNTYAGMLLDTSEEDNELWVFSVDLEKKTVHFHCGQSAFYLLLSDSVRLFEYSENDNTLIVLRDYSFGDTDYWGDSGMVGILEKYDLTSDQLLWQTDVIIETAENEYISSLQDVQVSIKDGFLVVGLGRYLSLYETYTGSLIYNHKANSEVSYVEVIRDPVFRYILADGEYGYAWLSASDKFHTDSIETEITDSSNFFMWKDGFLEIEIIDNSIERVEPTGSGFVAAVPDNANNTIIISRVAHLAEMVEHIEIMTANPDCFSYDTRAWTQGDMLVIGPAYKGSFYHDDLVVFVSDKDAPNDVVTMDIPLKNVGPEQIFVLPDLSGCLLYDNDSKTTALCDLSGNIHMMYPEDVAVDESYSTQYTYRYSNAVRRTDNTVVTARAEKNGLTIWLNETQLDNVTSLQYASDPRFKGVDTGSLATGENGYVLACVYSDNSRYTVGGIFIYNTVSEEHKVIDADNDIEFDYSSISIVCGKTEPLAALIDKGDNTYIYNLESGERINSFPLQLARDSISQVQFAHNDSLLLIMTNDDRLWGFDIKTGEAVICRKQDDANSYQTMFVETDSSGKRMYIYWKDVGVCIETTDWTVLSEMQDILGYDANRELIICSERKTFSDEYDIFGFRVPDTDELIEIGREALSIE